MSGLDLRNLSNDDISLLESVDITSNAQFLKLGADKTLKLLRESGIKPDHDIIYRLRGAEQDIDWRILADHSTRRAKSRFADVDEP